VIAAGNFTAYYNCSCRRSGESIAVSTNSSSAASVVCVASSGGGSNDRRGLIIGIVIVGVVPWILVAAAVYVCVV
jgi:hypothetical protein